MPGFVPALACCRWAPQRQALILPPHVEWLVSTGNFLGAASPASATLPNGGLNMAPAAKGNSRQARLERDLRALPEECPGVRLEVIDGDERRVHFRWGVVESGIAAEVDLMLKELAGDMGVRVHALLVAEGCCPGDSPYWERKVVCSPEISDVGFSPEQLDGSPQSWVQQVQRHSEAQARIALQERKLVMDTFSMALDKMGGVVEQLAELRQASEVRGEEYADAFREAVDAAQAAAEGPEDQETNAKMLTLAGQVVPMVLKAITQAASPAAATQPPPDEPDASGAPEGSDK